MKVLCLGNNTIDTEIKTQKLSGGNYNGLLSDITQVIVDGYYQTSLYDLSRADIVQIADRFDKIIVLDQPQNQYSHPDTFLITVSVGQEVDAEFLDHSYKTNINFFENLVKENKSFCIFPFIELLVNNGNTTVCCRSSTTVAKLKGLDFYNDIEYKKIRQQMLDNIPIPEHCSSCYKVESLGMQSARQQETVEWANRLNLQSIDDVLAIKLPAYYEVRPSNICNLQCRSCVPMCSNQIEKEYKSLGIISNNFQVPDYENFDFVNFNNLTKLYVAGGEPTAMIEFYQFLDRCIEEGNTNFELMINTNATKFSNKFKNQIDKFSNVTFIVSIDGIDSLNYYIRWPSDWSAICDNINWIYNSKHVLSFNVTVSIYNILGLYDILKFLENQCPLATIHCQLAEYKDDMLSPFNFNNSDMVVEKLKKIQNLHCYKNTKLLETFVDGLIQKFKNNQINTDILEKFFKFNDVLDASRSVKLVDYIPELEALRNEI